MEFILAVGLVVLFVMVLRLSARVEMMDKLFKRDQSASDQQGAPNYDSVAVTAESTNSIFADTVLPESVYVSSHEPIVATVLEPSFTKSFLYVFKNIKQ